MFVFIIYLMFQQKLVKKRNIVLLEKKLDLCVIYKIKNRMRNIQNATSMNVFLQKMMRGKKMLTIEAYCRIMASYHIVVI